MVLRCIHRLIFAALILTGLAANAQPEHYSVANAHSHNDYENPVPFYTAYNAGFGSIEADIFLIHGTLLVAHDFKELQKNRSIEDYYIKPLLAFVQKNNGYAFADTSKRLQMLIDIKTGAVNTLDSFIALLKKYPLLISNTSIQWVITGNRPADSTFGSYPSFIWFDGLLFKDYSLQALQKIQMMSDDFKSYSAWRSEGKIPPADLYKLKQAIEKCHAVSKKVRFWDAPDNPTAWSVFIKLGVDFINTDKIEELKSFLENTGQSLDD
jgi:alkaline phosphatase